eukprot:Gb_07195 [translate_table: standard]
MGDGINSTSTTPFTSTTFEAKGEETQCLMKFDEKLEQIIERDAQEGIIEEEKVIKKIINQGNGYEKLSDEIHKQWRITTKDQTCKFEKEDGMIEKEEQLIGPPMPQISQNHETNFEMALEKFAPHIQQFNIERNGKRVPVNGSPLSYEAREIDFGELDTNGQQIYQSIHQGQIIPDAHAYGKTPKVVDSFKDSTELEEATRFVKNNVQQVLTIEQIIVCLVSVHSILEAKTVAEWKVQLREWVKWIFIRRQ